MLSDLCHQVTTILLFFLFGLGMTKAEFRVLPDETCKALETSEKAVELRGGDIFFYHLSFASVIPQKVRNGYLESIDEKGKTCFGKIDMVVNKTIDGFRKEIISIAKDEIMMKVYFRKTGILVKRAAVSAVALAISVVDLIATGASYFYQDWQLRVLREKLMSIDEMVQDMVSDRDILKGNQDYLFKEGKILGVNENLLVGHFNQLQRLHSCDVVRLKLEAEISKVNDKLYRLKSAILRREFNHNVLGLEALRKLTLMDSFRDTIYIMAPLELYRRAKLTIYNATEEGVTFIVSYPDIGRTPVHKIVSLLETSPSHLFPRDSNLHFQFLLPIDTSLSTLNLTNTVPHSTDSCIRLNGIMACHALSVLPSKTLECLDSLFSQKGDKSCFGGIVTKTLALAYGEKGVLVETRGESDILDAKTGQIKRRLKGHVCTYAENHQDLAIRFGTVVTPIFKDHLVVNADNFFSTKTLNFQSKTVENVSLPEVENPFSYRNLTYSRSKSLLHYLENPYVSGAIVTVFICLAIVFSLVTYCVSRCCTSGGTTVGVHVGALDGGRIGAA